MPEMIPHFCCMLDQQLMCCIGVIACIGSVMFKLWLLFDFVDC
jgi:hypothetical protein